MSARIAELEQSADEARRRAEQTQQELAALIAEHARCDAAWQQAREQLVAEAAERERAWQQQADAWEVEHEQWQDDLLSLANARQQLAAEFNQRQTELLTEATRWQTECEKLRDERQQQATVEAVEREHWQKELESLTSSRQQMTDEFEERQSHLKTTALGWQTKCESLHADWQRQQAAWAEERTRLLEESQRQMEEIAQQVAATREQELAEQSQQLLAERQQIEAERTRVESERQQLQAARLDSEQALAELSAERKRLEDLAAEVQSKSDEHAQRMAEFEKQQVQLTRDQQVLEHSQNWVQSDRRKLVDEKTQWQQQCADRQAEREAWEAEREQQRLQLEEFEKNRGQWREEHGEAQLLAVKRDQLEVEREQLSAEREQLAAERVAWTQKREQLESERQANITQLEAAYAEPRTPQQTLHEEQEPLQTLRTDWDAHAAEVPVERQAVDSETPPFSEDHRAWDNDRTAWEHDSLSARPQSPNFADEPLRSLNDDWSIGVDLTAPREVHSAEPLFEPAGVSDWPTALTTHPLTEATSLDQVGANEAAAPPTDWDDTSGANGFDRVANTEVGQASAWESPAETVGDRSTTIETLDPAVAALRAELAEKFQLPGLRETLTETSACEQPTLLELSNEEQVVDEAANNEPVADEPVIVESSIAEPAEPEQVVPEAVAPESVVAEQVAPEPAEAPSSGASVNILGSLAFSDDEPVDDSVSRYMQHLLARSQRSGENGDDRFGSPSPHQSSRTEPARPTSLTSPIRVAEIDVTDDADSSGAESPSSAKLRAMQAEPAHKQDKDAIRAVTERMRQVANQQTLNVVQASNSIRLRRSIKMKSCLAAFAFVLSAGLLFLGYSYKPDFLILGMCAAALGVLTWVDLFFAIRDARRRTSQLAGRKKKA